MNNTAKPPQRVPLMLENGQDYCLRERLQIRKTAFPEPYSYVEAN
jgi:hypothetical protein